MQTRSRALPLLMLASLACVLMVWGRVFYTGRVTFVFLCWNLFLAWIPVALSLALARLGAERGLLTLGLGGVWLAFFPNAPYLVTDLVHLRARSPVPLWFDALLIAGFMVTGLGLGFLSLRQVHGLVERRWGPRAGWRFVAAVSVLTGVGIYVGRFLRWNSWDLVTRPGQLLADAAGWAGDPLAGARSAILAAAFGALFGASYLLLFRATCPVPSRRSA